MKKLILVFATIIMVVSLSMGDDCRDGLVDSNNYFSLNQVTVSAVTVIGDKVRVDAGKTGGCGHIFYFLKSEKEMLSVVLTAKSTGVTVNLYFLADANSPDVSLGGTIATHILGGIGLN